MNKKSVVPKSQKQGRARVIKQMDSWIQHETNLSLLISGSLVHLVLFGRLVARQDEVFLFDAHGEFCRVVLVPEQYNCLLSNQLGSALVLLKDASEGEIRLTEDLRGAVELPGVFHAPGQELQPAG
jgi:hypothetical protein